MKTEVGLYIYLHNPRLFFVVYPYGVDAFIACIPHIPLRIQTLPRISILNLKQILETPLF